MVAIDESFDVVQTPEPQRSQRLNDQLMRGTDLGACEAMEAYRRYLDERHIKAEDDSGWPSEMAYSQFNIRKFISSWKANNGRI